MKRKWNELSWSLLLPVWYIHLLVIVKKCTSQSDMFIPSDFQKTTNKTRVTAQESAVHRDTKKLNVMQRCQCIWSKTKKLTPERITPNGYTKITNNIYTWSVVCYKCCFIQCLQGKIIHLKINQVMVWNTGKRIQPTMPKIDVAEYTLSLLLHIPELQSFTRNVPTGYCRSP